MNIMSTLFVDATLGPLITLLCRLLIEFELEFWQFDKVK